MENNKISYHKYKKQGSQYSKTKKAFHLLKKAVIPSLLMVKPILQSSVKNATS